MLEVVTDMMRVERGDGFASEDDQKDMDSGLAMCIQQIGAQADLDAGVRLYDCVNRLVVEKGGVPETIGLEG